MLKNHPWLIEANRDKHPQLFEMIDSLSKALQIEVPLILIDIKSSCFDARRRLINEKACIVITNELLNFPFEEQMAVLAHELCHIKFGSCLLQRTLDSLHRRSQLRPRSQLALSILIGVPLALFQSQPLHIITTLFAISMIALIAILAYHKVAGRYLERKCDLHAVEATGLHGPMINVLKRVQHMCEHNYEKIHTRRKMSSKLAILLFDPHPPFEKRINYITKNKDASSK